MKHSTNQTKMEAIVKNILLSDKEDKFIFVIELPLLPFYGINKDSEEYKKLTQEQIKAVEEENKKAQNHYLDALKFRIGRITLKQD